MPGVWPGVWGLVDGILKIRLSCPPCTRTVLTSTEEFGAEDDLVEMILRMEACLSE